LPLGPWAEASMMRHDVLIVGTRCSGSSLAMLLARRAATKFSPLITYVFPVTPFRRTFCWRERRLSLEGGVIGKIIGDGLSSDRAGDGRLWCGCDQGRPSPVDGTAIMYCPRRTVLDLMLVQAARAAGAELRQSDDISRAHLAKRQSGRSAHRGRERGILQKRGLLLSSGSMASGRRQLGPPVR
jgi:hypothetical protein